MAGIYGDWETNLKAVKGVLVVADQDVVFANNAPVNTQNTVNITLPFDPASINMLAVYNPSTVSDLTVKVFGVEDELKAASRAALITSISVPKSQSITGTTINTYLSLVQGIFAATNLRLVISNDTVLGGAEGFTATIRLKTYKK
jgi:hypothetical protein